MIPGHGRQRRLGKLHDHQRPLAIHRLRPELEVDDGVDPDVGRYRSKGGNLLLDVGPTPDGVFPPPAVERLEAIGRWMRANGESIYGTVPSPFAEPFAWGRCTAKPLTDGETRLYLHVFDWPADGRW